MSNTQQDAGPSTGTETQGSGKAKKLVVILCIGMAGSVSQIPFGSGMTNSTGQDDTDATSELLPTYSEQATLYSQPRPGCSSYAI